MPEITSAEPVMANVGQKGFDVTRCSLTKALVLVRHCCAMGASLALPLVLIAEVQAQDLTYVTNNGTITVTGYTGPGGAVNIPSTIDGLLVVNIEFPAFEGKSLVTSVVIPNSVTNIGPNAFANCTSLTNVSMGYGVINIGHHVFAYCTSLISATIPYSLTNIADWAFTYCTNLANVLIPNTVASIGSGAFSHISVISVTIPSGVMSIGDKAFLDCTNLTRVATPDSLLTIGDSGFEDCLNLTNVVIGNSVTNIGRDAFYGCPRLTGVYFRGNAPSVGFLAFYSDLDANVYYVPGTTGWGQTFADLPAVLWNPHVQIGDASFGVRQNRFGFNIAGTTDIPLVVEACTNLPARSWVPLQSCTLTNGLLYFSDPHWTNYPGRFYRIRSP